MKRDSLLETWKKANQKIKYSSPEELEQILSSKMDQIMKKHFTINFTSVSVGLLLIAFLVYTAIRRSADIYFVINNIFVCLITIAAVTSGIWSYYKMRRNTLGLPLKDWLKYRINAIVKSQKRLAIRYLFAVTAIMPVYMSFFTYFINRPFVKVIQSEQFYSSFLIAFIGGSISAIFAIWSINVRRKRYLESLKDLYNQCI